MDAFYFPHSQHHHDSTTAPRFRPRKQKVKDSEKEDEVDNWKCTKKYNEENDEGVNRHLK